jgi:hypothetical protein
MIIQLLLMAGLLVALFYAFLQRRKARFVSVLIASVSLVGIYFVLQPEQASRVAHFVGVGRGADLIVYLWIVLTLIVCLNLQLKILRLQENLTALARRIAILGGKVPDRVEKG